MLKIVLGFIGGATLMLVVLVAAFISVHHSDLPPNYFTPNSAEIDEPAPPEKYAPIDGFDTNRRPDHD